MSKPAVSVVVPTRNRADLLPVAIRSALGQTFSDLEIIIVDDASEDATPEVAARFADPRIRSLRLSTRSGGAAARNAGIRAAHAEVIAFLDDDDEWLPEKTALQLDLLRGSAAEVGAVYSSYTVVERATGRVLGRKAAQRRGDLSADLLERNVIGGTSSVIVRRHCLERVGLFDERLPSFQDYDLWIRLSGDSLFDFVERDLLRYYVHGEKIWSNLDALSRGIEIMVEKHGSSRALRRNLASQSLRVGAQYCSEGQTGKGRGALLRAIRLDPFAARPYLNFAISFLGEAGFRAVHGAKRRLIPTRDSAAGASTRPPDRSPSEVGR